MASKLAEAGSAREQPEARELLHSGPHGGAGTLFDEHQAVMRLVDFHEFHDVFHEFHDVAPSGATTNYYFVAQDADDNPTTPNLWSEVGSWLIETYDLILQDFVESPAARLPATGDDVQIPEGLTFTYHVGPGTITC